MPRPTHYRRRTRDTLIADAVARTGNDIALYVQEAVTRRLVEDVVEEVHEVRDRITGLFFAVFIAAIADILARIIGR